MKKIFKKVLRLIFLHSYEKKNYLLKFFLNIFFLSIIFIYNYKKIFTKEKKILFLSYKRFRGDIEIIDKKFCSLIIPFFIQTFFLYLIFKSEKKIQINNFFFKSNTYYRNKRKKLRNLISFFLIPVLKFINVKIIISPSIHYIQDIDIGISGKQNGINFLIFHRENLTILSDQIKALKSLYSCFDKIILDYVIFHNEKTKDIFLKSKLLTKKQCIVLGGIRMDDFIKNLNQKKSGSSISFFSFHKLSSIPTDIQNKPKKIYRFEYQKKGWNKLWKTMHVEFFQLALNNPKTKFILKTKWGGNWIKSIEDLWIKNFNKNSLPNLHLTSNDNTHSIINDSKLVIGFNSTVLLEAGLRKIPVLVPNFQETKTLKKYVLHEHFKGCFTKFEDFKILDNAIKGKMSKLYPNKIIMNRRQYYFKKYVNPLNKNLKKNYFIILNSMIKKNNV